MCGSRAENPLSPGNLSVKELIAHTLPIAIFRSEGSTHASQKQFPAFLFLFQGIHQTVSLFVAPHESDLAHLFFLIGRIEAHHDSILRDLTTLYLPTVSKMLTLCSEYLRVSFESPTSSSSFALRIYEPVSYWYRFHL